MCFEVVAMAGSTMMKMGAQQQAAEATARNERRLAMQMIIDREMGKVQAMQRQNQRVEDYLSAEKSNLAIFSASGVDVESESIKAFEESNAIKPGEDLRSIAFQAAMTAKSSTMESQLARERSANALSAGYINSMGTAFEGIYGLSQISTDGIGLSNAFEFFTTPFDLI